MNSGGMTRKLGDLMGEIRVGMPFVPVFLKRPAVAGHWLGTARAAQIALLVIALTLPVLTLTFDSLLKAVFPAKKTTALFGLIERKHANPLQRTGQIAVRLILWAGSGGIIVLLLLRNAPKAAKSAEEKSKEFESTGDSLIEADPVKSLELYRSALSFALDPDASASLGEKIKTLEKKYHVGTGKISPGGEKEGTVAGTVVMSPAEATVYEPGSGPMPEVTASRYRTKETLGRGATGVVYLAHDDVLDRDVAIKELHTMLAHDRDLVFRFRQEAKVLARMVHPGIVQVYDFVEEKEHARIVMELVEGRELADYLKERGRLPVNEAAGLGVRLAQALGYAHSRGIIHRDFKPSNVLLTASGIPKITDFGLAKIAQSAQHTMTGTVLGSPAYMSPEQAAGKNADSRSDVYSLGIVLYRMLVGRVPFGGEIVSIIAQHIGSRPVAPHETGVSIPSDLERLVLSMLEKDPEQRIQDMGKVAEGLSPFV